MGSKRRRRKKKRQEFKAHLNRSAFISEIKTEGQLNRYGLYGYKRNFIIDRYYGDFVWKYRKVVLEVDGSSHANKKNYDLKRQKKIESHGYAVFRINYPFDDNLLPTLRAMALVLRVRSEFKSFNIACKKLGI